MKTDISLMRMIFVFTQAVLTIRPGVVMEFAPNVGILVLGVLKAQGDRGQQIIMKPMKSHEDLESNKIRKRAAPFPTVGSESIRLCTGRNCTVQMESNEYGKCSARCNHVQSH